MKVFILIFFAQISFLSHLIGQDFSEDLSSIEHLYCVNKQWVNHVGICPDKKVNFSSDNKRIEYHLELVINELKNNIPAGFSKNSLKQRNLLLDSLAIYAKKQEFPCNTKYNERRPCFIDNFGVHCAVGYLMQASGSEKLAQQISQDYNFEYLEDILTPGIASWAFSNGFTIDELKWIQPSYIPNTTINQIGNATNGEVSDFYTHYNLNKLIFSGNFTAVDSLPCLNIGYYSENQLFCYEGGIEGTINDLGHASGAEVAVVGDIINDNQHFPVALFEDDSWNYYTIPQREGATGILIRNGLPGNKMLVVISHPSIIGMQEIWSLTYGGIWEKNATIIGSVSVVKQDILDLYFGGQFDTVFVGDQEQDTLYNLNNVLVLSNSNTWHGIPEGVICDNVKSIKKVGQTIYFGGEASTSDESSHILLTRYINNSLQPLISIEGYYLPDSIVWSINEIVYNGTENLILGGVYWRAGMGINGRNLLEYNLVDNTIEMLAMFDKPVNTIMYYDDHLFIGGNFNENGYQQPINYLARLENPLSVREVYQQGDIKIYPNPFSDKINITGLVSNTSYKIYASDGKLVKSGRTDGEISGLEGLTGAIYYLEILGERSEIFQVLKK